MRAGALIGASVPQEIERGHLLQIHQVRQARPEERPGAGDRAFEALSFIPRRRRRARGPEADARVAIARSTCSATSAPGGPPHALAGGGESEIDPGLRAHRLVTVPSAK